MVLCWCFQTQIWFFFNWFQATLANFLFPWFFFSLDLMFLEQRGHKSYLFKPELRSIGFLTINENMAYHLFFHFTHVSVHLALLTAVSNFFLMIFAAGSLNAVLSVGTSHEHTGNYMLCLIKRHMRLHAQIPTRHTLNYLGVIFSSLFHRGNLGFSFSLMSHVSSSLPWLALICISKNVGF